MLKCSSFVKRSNFGFLISFFYKLISFQIAEFDTPAALLANPDSSFSKLVQAMEISEEDHYLVE